MRSVCTTILLSIIGGLSSGESILLHLFTKLRYLLQGNIYDEESTDFITEESAQKVMLAQRKEFIVNCFEDDEELRCDSIFLFLDEADLSLHPEWQRMFIATLTEFLCVSIRIPIMKERIADAGIFRLF